MSNTDMRKWRSQEDVLVGSWLPECLSSFSLRAPSADQNLLKTMSDGEIETLTHVLVLNAATCRHCMPLKAVNLVGTGERYGYSHYLLTDLFYDMGVKFIHQDIACKHQPWRKRVQRAVLDSLDPAVTSSATFLLIERTLEAADSTFDVLPDMHGNLHAWSCQVS